MFLVVCLFCLLQNALDSFSTQARLHRQELGFERDCEQLVTEHNATLDSMQVCGLWHFKQVTKIIRICL